jgi:aryl-alcohol dehydrogenase-like predicted oxidoreductase/enamine deaminase RidA (YjgF/YER057c/UK114 family)
LQPVSHTRTVERRHVAQHLEISRVVTGLWQVADMERDGRTLDPDETARFMAPYVEAGFTSFDMADHYGSAEIIAGRHRERAGGGVELFTKWVPKPGPVSRHDVRDAVQRSLDRMRGTTIDLLQFHAWSFADPWWLDALFYLQELKDEGLIRQLGLTNCDTAHLRIAVTSGVEIATNQVSFSLLDRRAAGRMSELCLSHGVRLLAYGTIAGGFLSERWLRQPEPDWERLATWSQMKYGRFLRVAGGWEALQRVLAVAERVAARHRVSIANVACRYILDQPAVAGVIIGARLGERDHIADNLRLFEVNLTAEDRAELLDALSTLDQSPGDCGDEYRRPPFLTASGDLSHHLESFPLPYPVDRAPGDRRRASTGTSWETLAGYSRAVRVGDRVFVSGTTATHDGRCIGGKDPAAQAHFVIDKLDGSLRSLGGRLEDVVRTRVFVSHIDHWEVVARAHGERFAEVRPANTLVEARLVGPEYLVEIEAEAIVTPPEGHR